jgi:hypothetical protein
VHFQFEGEHAARYRSTGADRFCSAFGEHQVASNVRVSGEFRIGRVLARAARIWGRNIVPLTVICLLATLPLFMPRMLAGAHVMTQQQLFRSIPLLLTTFVTSPLSYAIFVCAVFQHLATGSVQLGAAIAQAFGRILPLLACAFCQVFAIAGGMILLIVPGFIVMTMLAVAAQVCVIERLGPIASLSRSAALTKGVRWRVFGLLLVIGVISLAGEFAYPLQRYFGLAGVMVAFLLSGCATAYINTVYAVQFHDLRVAKEGIGTERIAAVFD